MINLGNISSLGLEFYENLDSETFRKIGESIEVLLTLKKFTINTSRLNSLASEDCLYLLKPISRIKVNYLKFDFSNSGMEDNSMETFISYLTNCMDLQTFELKLKKYHHITYSTIVSSSSFVNLMNSLLYLTSIHELVFDFSGCHFQSLSPEDIINYLEQMNYALSLNLSSCDLPKQTVFMVSRYMKDNLSKKKQHIVRLNKYLFLTKEHHRGREGRAEQRTETGRPAVGTSFHFAHPGILASGSPN